jgi:hypothetical protein
MLMGDLLISISLFSTESTTSYVDRCCVALEAAGAAIMRRDSVGSIGGHLVTAGESLHLLSSTMFPSSLNVANINSHEASAKERLDFSSEQMILAGNELQGNRVLSQGKSWLLG